MYFVFLFIFFFFFIILSFVDGLVFADVPYPKQYGFQDPATLYVENMVNLHHDIMMFLILICIFVFYMLLATFFNFNANVFIHPPVDVRHNTFIEIVWTLIPTLILILIAIPSFALLYSLEEYHEPFIHIKAVGNQWYWTYECSDFYDMLYDPFPYEVGNSLRTEDVIFWQFNNASASSWGFYFEPGVLPLNTYAAFLDNLKSFFWINKPFRHSATMLSELDVLSTKGKALRLLSTDNILVLPSHVWIKLSVTANDVLHSWTIPSFGVKLDGCPGRLNSSLLYIKREGVFYGQCSEICGVQHGFMPIEVHVVDAGRFLKYAIRNL